MLAGEIGCKMICGPLISFLLFFLSCWTKLFVCVVAGVYHGKLYVDLRLAESLSFNKSSVILTFVLVKAVL